MSPLFLSAPLGETTRADIGEARRTGRTQGEIWLRALRLGVPAQFVTFSDEAFSAMSKTLPPSAMGRAAIESRRVKAELPEPHRVAVRCRAVVRDMMFSEHWIWRDGEQHFLPAGLRFLADAHAHESDSAAAVVCRRLADELEQAEQHIPKLAADMAKAGGRVDLTQPEIYAEMERRGFA